MPRQIDRKFHVTDDGQIADRDGELIPEDEPLFLLRGRDALALPLLARYEELGVTPSTRRARAGLAHMETLHLVIADFIRWQRLHPDEVHTPQGSENDDYSRPGAQMTARGSVDLAQAARVPLSPGHEGGNRKSS